jgi:hypothetical protein
LILRSTKLLGYQGSPCLEVSFVPWEPFELRVVSIPSVLEIFGVLGPMAARQDDSSDLVETRISQTYQAFFLAQTKRNLNLCGLVLEIFDNLRFHFHPSLLFSKCFRKCGSYFRKHFESNKEKLSRGSGDNFKNEK